jgi:hypothetical protein
MNCSVSIITYVPHPHQLLPWHLIDPDSGFTTGDGITIDSRGD